MVDPAFINNGTVFEIAKTGNTYSAPTILASFNGTDQDPLGNLTTDAAGDFFGTTFDGEDTNQLRRHGVRNRQNRQHLQCADNTGILQWHLMAKSRLAA